ncbi:hypothetical protein [Burkholderia plantarii]|nr:hypothetical protein [Burkholderia plantarii]
MKKALKAATLATSKERFSIVTGGKGARGTGLEAINADPTKARRPIRVL